MFLLLIKPIRENLKFFMLQFNSLDRPEDRSNTLKWITLRNILPGLILGTMFKQLFERINEPNLVFIIIFIIGICDGLAEPVGIYRGKKNILRHSGFLKEGMSGLIQVARVFLSGIIFTLVFMLSLIIWRNSSLLITL